MKMRPRVPWPQMTHGLSMNVERPTPHEGALPKTLPPGARHLLDKTETVTHLHRRNLTPADERRPDPPAPLHSAQPHL
jgi:hypothetical protein